MRRRSQRTSTSEPVQGTHEYAASTQILKAFSILRRQGAGALFLRIRDFLVFRTTSLFAPLIISRIPRSTFVFKGVRLSYFYHAYNNTWTNLRMVEIPIALNYISKYRGAHTLEIGAVLPHYVRPTWDVLDKFEKGHNIINEDIVSFKPRKKYDLIVTISTLEHVGFDDDVIDPQKISRAIAHIRKYCLRKGGLLLITMPVGYNPHADRYVSTHRRLFASINVFRRISAGQSTIVPWSVARRTQDECVVVLTIQN